MKKSRLLAPLVCSLILCFLIPSAMTGIWDAYHTKEEKIQMWKNLWERNSEDGCMYGAVARTYNGMELTMFVCGSPGKPKVMWDAEMHGNEDPSGEVLYMIAKWLLESNDRYATEILEENWLFFFPVIGDSHSRSNSDTEYCKYGVNLNRNFQTGWKYIPCSSDENYAGPYPCSERETNILRFWWSILEPKFYVNLHSGSEGIMYYDKQSSEIRNDVLDRYRELCSEFGCGTYSAWGTGSNGYAIGDCYALGCPSTWLVEVQSGWNHTIARYIELANVMFPRCKALFISQCELSR